jgi:hypothetical protein
LSKAFAAWLLRESERDADLASIADRAATREGAEQDFQTVAILGFAAGASILSAAQTETLKKGLGRLAGRKPVVNGVPMAFCSDAVGIFGVALGTRAVADANITSLVVPWITRFLRSSYEMDRTEDWQRCLFAVAERQLGSPLDLSIPKSAATADVRTALRASGLLDPGDGAQAREDTVQTLKLAVQEPPKDFAYDRAALRLAAVEWVIGTGRPPADQSVPVTRMDGSVEWINPENYDGTDPAVDPLKPFTAQNHTGLARSAEADRPSVVLGTAGQPKSRPTGGAFAADPKIRNLVEKDPNLLPHVNLVAHIQQAQAEGEVAFRQRELEGQWKEWCGVYPWDVERDPDTTDCPWWLAGAEYVFHLAAAWRNHSPGAPEKIEALLPKQIELAADWVYWKKVYLHDMVFGKNSTVEHIFGGHAKRFWNVAFLFAMRKFAEGDLDEWRGRVAVLAGAITDLKSASANESAPQSAPGVSEPPAPAEKNEVQETRERHKVKKPVRRNQKYKTIDEALQRIADSRPRTQEEVFKALEGRVVFPPAEPFETGRGWIAGFRRDKAAARSWLSKRWAELSLSPLPRGPKNPKK